MNNITTRLMWWWGWNPNNMEKMLESMEKSGWNLYQVDLIGTRFRFQKGKEQKVRYCADYQADADDEYFNIYKDAGWSIKWTGANGWYLWMKTYEGERPNIFTDTASLIERNNRLLKVLTPIFAIIVIIFAILMVSDYDALKPLIYAYVILIALYTFLFYQVARHNKKLKNDIRD